MTAPDPFAHETRCDLLCFLVIGQLIEHTGRGNWLSATRVSARVRLWLGSGHPGVTRADQRTLVRLSIGLASVLQSQAVFHDQEMLARLSLEAWRLNFHEPLLAALRAACEDRLERAAAAAAGPVPPASPADPAEAGAGAPSAPRQEALTRAVTLSVAAIRKAQGKLNPSDLSADSPAWQTVCDDFTYDLRRAPRLTADTLYEAAGDAPAAPAARMPAARTPDARMPDARTPDARTPDAHTQDAPTPDASTPDAPRPPKKANRKTSRGS